VHGLTRTCLLTRQVPSGCRPSAAPVIPGFRFNRPWERALTKASEHCGKGSLKSGIQLIKQANAAGCVANATLSTGNWRKARPLFPSQTIPELAFQPLEFPLSMGSSMAPIWSIGNPISRMTVAATAASIAATAARQSDRLRQRKSENLPELCHLTLKAANSTRPKGHHSTEENHGQRRLQVSPGKKRVNCHFQPTTGGVQEEVELPLKTSW